MNCEERRALWQLVRDWKDEAESKFIPRRSIVRCTRDLRILLTGFEAHPEPPAADLPQKDTP